MWGGKMPYFQWNLSVLRKLAIIAIIFPTRWITENHSFVETIPSTRPPDWKLLKPWAVHNNSSYCISDLETQATHLYFRTLKRTAGEKCVLSPSWFILGHCYTYEVAGSPLGSSVSPLPYRSDQNSMQSLKFGTGNGQNTLGSAPVSHLGLLSPIHVFPWPLWVSFVIPLPCFLASPCEVTNMNISVVMCSQWSCDLNLPVFSEETPPATKW